VADLTAATVAAEAVVGGGTHENDARAWSRYTKYCDSIGLNRNYFLNGMPRQHRIAIMGAFAMAIREGRFSRLGDGPLAKKSVKGSVNTVAATFQENGQEDPHRDAERHVGPLLQRQLRSYTKDDPKEIQQKALPVCVYSLILFFPSHRITPHNRRTCGSSAFLGNAVVQILQSFKSREATNKAALSLKHHFHQRRKYSQPHICQI
jgi:hypothetical protein